jgi:hypothetical protein
MTTPTVKRNRPQVAPMKFPTLIIEALQTSYCSYYDKELEFIDYIKNCIETEEEEISNITKYIQSGLECHPFYVCIISRFLEDRNMTDITDEKFNEYVLEYCGGIESQIMENPVDEDDDDLSSP